jgi:hypothetical protein
MSEIDESRDRMVEKHRKSLERLGASSDPEQAIAARLGDADVTWESAATRLGEELATVGPEGYYGFTPIEWLNWCLAHVETLTQQVAQAEQARDAAHAALRSYGQHDPSCADPETEHPCTCGLVAALAASAPQNENEEYVAHQFRSRTPYEPGDDRDIWCADCEYHRDHRIHAPAQETERGR